MMRLVFPFLLALLFLSSTLFAQRREGNTIHHNDGPFIKWEETTWDFGEIFQGEPTRHTFIYTNVGNQDLIFDRVKSSCGCVSPKWDREPIPPGGKGSIEVAYDSKRIGAFNKSLRAFSNALNGRTVLYIKGMVKPAPIFEAEDIISANETK